MPDFTSLLNFEAARNLKAYLYLKAGVTRGAIQDPAFSRPLSREDSSGQDHRAEEQRTEERSPVFFIVGHGKSGTTWLARLLGSHPEILCLWEGRFFNRDWHRGDLEEMEARVPPRSLYGVLANSKELTLWLQRSVWARNENPEKHLSNLTRLAVDYFLRQRLQESGKRIVGDKTPFLPGADVLREISEIYPEAKIIHIIRDGRDAEVSWTHHRWNRATDRGGIQVLRPGEAERRDAYNENPRQVLESGIFDEEELRSRAALWREVVGGARKTGPELFGGNYLEVHYEDLLEDTASEAGRLMEALGASAGKKVVRRCVEQASFEKMSRGRQRGEEDPDSLLRKGVSGDWRNVFTQKEKEIFKEEAGSLLVELSYEGDDSW